MNDYRNKPHKLIMTLAKKQIQREKDQFIGTTITDPVLKPILGPNATQPLQEGEDAGSHPDAVLAWFCDVRLDASQSYLHDVIVPTQARGNIGQAGSPVVVYKDRASGAWQVVGRADRITEFQSVKSYTTVELSVGYVRGLIVDGNSVYSAFWPYRQSGKAVVSATQNGNQQAGLNRGRAFVGGLPVANFQRGSTLVPVPFDEIEWGVDPFGVLYKITYNADGTTTQEKVSPI